MVNDFIKEQCSHNKKTWSGNVKKRNEKNMTHYLLETLKKFESNEP